MRDLMMNKEIRRLLRERLNLSTSGLYKAIARKKSQLDYAYPTEIAAYVLAAENRIDISKHLKPEELAQVRQARLTRSVQARQPQTRTYKVQRHVVVNFDRDLKIDCPNIPESILRDAKKMQEVYPYFYVFENSIRFFIMEILERKYGEEWWTQRVSKKIRDRVTKRQSEEGHNKWHGKRGSHPIFYTNIDHLKKIITANLADFKDKLPDIERPIEWLANRIEEIELSRNIIAHNNPLSNDDIARVKLYFKDWVKQIS